MGAALFGQIETVAISIGCAAAQAPDERPDVVQHLQALGLFLDEECPHLDDSVTTRVAGRRAVVADHDVLARIDADPSTRNELGFVCPKDLHSS